MNEPQDDGQAVSEPHEVEAVSNEQALTAELEAVRAEALASKEEAEKNLRIAAELQNALKRQQNEWERQRRFAAQGIIEDLLPVLDDFSRGLAAYAEGLDHAKVIEGFQGVQRQMLRALEAHGVQRIVALGAALDPELHEAVGIEPNDELDEDTVVEELRAGYRLHERLVRPAQVRVSKKSGLP
jgi:molecular chaperone GrpE